MKRSAGSARFSKFTYERALIGTGGQSVEGGRASAWEP